MIAMVSALLLSGLAHANHAPEQGTWKETLQSRDLDGDHVVDAYFDAALNVTWLADANFAKTSGYDGDGNMSWYDAVAWADGLTIGAFDGWRLPSVTQFDPSEGCQPGVVVGGVLCGYTPDPSRSELAHMFFTTLGNKALLDIDQHVQVGWGLTNKGSFLNLAATNYWSGTEYANSPSMSWYFNTDQGFQSNEDKFASYPYSAWAVHDGDVGAPIPEPGTTALLATGLIAMVLVRNRHRQAAAPR